MRLALRFLLALLLGLAVWQAPVVAQLPAPRGFVNDFAGVLDEPSRAEIDALLRDVADTTSAEIALVTVRSLEGMTVEDYAVRLFSQWGIGKKDADNGVLILVSPADRAMRIEVGYGLEAVLPDGLAGEIIRNDFLPAFRDSDYALGIRQGVSRVVEVVRRGDVAPAQLAVDDDRPPLWFVVPFLSVFAAVGAFAIGVGVRSKTYGPMLFGGLFAAIPAAMALFQFFGVATVVIGSVGAAMLALGYSRGGSSYWRTTLRGPSASADDQGWVAGTSSGSSSSDSGSSGSDFGGGSSGGGGASGRW